MSRIASKIIWNISRILKERNLTQAWLADELEMSKPQLSNYLSGKVRLPIETAERIAGILSVEFGEFMGVPPSPDAPAREPTELEMMAYAVVRSEIHPARKPAILGLLSDHIEETRLAAVEAILKASDLAGTAEEMALAIFDSLGIEGTRGELIRFILEHEDVNYEFYLDAMKSPSGPAAVPGSDNGEPELA